MTPIALFYWRQSGAMSLGSVHHVVLVFTPADIDAYKLHGCVEAQLLFLAGNGMYGDLRRAVELVAANHQISVQVSDFCAGGGLGE